MGMRVKKQLIYEFWDCPQCGAQGILGSAESCPHCSKPRNQSIKFYRKSDQEILVEQEKLSRHSGGADWICEYCDGLNAAMLTHCGSCTAEKSANAKTVVDPGPKDIPPPKVEALSKGPPTKSRRRLILGLVVASIAALLYWSMAAEKNTYRVDQVSWSRKIIVERYVREFRESWEDEQTGDDISLLTKKSKVRSYKDVLDHYKTETYSEEESYQSGSREKCSTEYKSTGNGAAEKITACHDEPVYATRQITKTREVPVYRKEPVYANWVRYQSSFYKDHQVFESSGTNNAPQWPKTKLGTGVSQRPDREGARDGLYRVTLRRMSPSKKAPPSVTITTIEKRFVDHYEIGKEIAVDYQNVGGLQWPEGDKEESSSTDKP